MQEVNKGENQHTVLAPTRKKVLVFVVCFNAEQSIENVLERIPKGILESEDFYTEVLVIDDQSSDRTIYAAAEYGQKYPQWNLTILYNPKGQGYGGNQKLGFRYAIKNGFDAIVLLRGDGLYAPEYLEQMIRPILDGQADATLGSRMIRSLKALQDGMPLYKWTGNKTLTFVQNGILQSHLSEFHSGFRAYNVQAVASVPFEHNSNDFDFDTDIIIQLLDTQKHISEIDVPTFYGKEISAVNGFRIAIRVIRACTLSRVMKLGIYYHPKFDYLGESNYRYKEKFGYPSSHQFAMDHVRNGATVLDIGCGPGFMAEHLAKKDVKTVSIDRQIQDQTKKNSWKCVESDVEKYDFADDFGKVDFILALDIIEHLKSPEKLFRVLRQRFSRDESTLIITTGNVAFLPIRVSLLFSGFHYGSRGILDMTHTRLFTFSSLQRVLDLGGYEVVEKYGLPAPFPLALGDGPLARFLLSINRALIALSKSLFAYQIAVIVKPLPTLEHLLENAVEAKKIKLSNPE